MGRRSSRAREFQPHPFTEPCRVTAWSERVGAHHHTSKLNIELQLLVTNYNCNPILVWCKSQTCGRLIQEEYAKLCQQAFVIYFLSPSQHPHGLPCLAHRLSMLLFVFGDSSFGILDYLEFLSEFQFSFSCTHNPNYFIYNYAKIGIICNNGKQMH